MIDHALTGRVLTFQTLAEFLDHADGLVAKNEARSDWILSLDDMDVCSADRRDSDADKPLRPLSDVALPPPPRGYR